MSARTATGSFAMDGLLPGPALAEDKVWSRAEREPVSGDASATAADDGALMRAARAGDEQAFVALYRRWQGPIYRFALHMGGSESLAEDVTQEVFVALAEECHRFNADKGQLSSYLFGIARNLLRRRLRREGFYEAADPGPSDGAPNSATVPAADAASDPSHAFDRDEAIQLVRRAVRALPVSFREAIVLCDLQELSYADAAAVIGCPIGTVRSRLHRARHMLAERLGAATSVKRGEP
jgi:RNA polymerase sigma-70 factor, ECF subfamily